MTNTFKYVIAVGVSSGGLAALETVLPKLPDNYPYPLLIVQHLSRTSGDYLVQHLDALSSIHVCYAKPRMRLAKASAYIAPPGYHLLVERDGCLSLSVDSAVQYSIPSVDVLFESVAQAFRQHAVGVVLTGANKDGAAGISSIKARGGITIAQDLETAEQKEMPNAAIATNSVDKVLSLHGIAKCLCNLE